MSIKKSQAILKRFLDLKFSLWLTLSSENETMFRDTKNFFQLPLSSCSVLTILTGSRPRKSSKCHKTWFRFLSPAEPNARLESTKHRLTFLNRHVIVWIAWDS